jgi:hypothetical protein
MTKAFKSGSWFSLGHGFGPRAVTKTFICPGSWSLM